jgi:hypothetical protein
MLEPGQTGYKPSFAFCFRMDRWFLERLHYDRVYEPGECQRGVICYFGWHNNNAEEAKQWLIHKEEKDGLALEKVELVSIEPWTL